MKGKFIVVEGPDGCGKSTQAKLLAEALSSKGADVVFCREPGGTPIGEKIRAILSDPVHKKMTVQTEVMLYMASRAQLVEEVIKPAIAEGKIVVCDRFLLSSVVYQGIVGGFGEENVFAIGKHATAGLEPDITVMIDLPIKESFKRTGSAAKDQGFLFSEAPDRQERKGKTFHEQVYDGYKQVAKSGKFGIISIDGRGTEEEVHKRVMEVVSRVI